MKEGFKGGEFDVLMPSSFERLGKRFPRTVCAEKLHPALGDSALAAGQYAGFVFNLRRPLFQSQKTRFALAMVFDFPWSNANLFFNQYTRTHCFFENSPD